MPDELVALFERYNEVARLLPDDVDTEGDVATARVVRRDPSADQRFHRGGRVTRAIGFPPGARFCGKGNPRALLRHPVRVE
jgi:hypothetical protein